MRCSSAASWAVIVTAVVAPAAAAAETGGTVAVDVKRKPTDSKWIARATRTLNQLRGFEPAERVPRDEYGGLVGGCFKATGFFRTERIGRRWWLIDPLGNRFLHIGVCSVSPGGTDFSRRFAGARFGTDARWAAWTNALLAENGFNGTGAWSANDPLRAAPQPPVYTRIWHFMGAFGRARNLTHQQPGHLGYPRDVIPVFHPDFAPFCMRYAGAAARTREDPRLLGHFSDNELPWPGDLLDRSLKLDRSDPDLRYGYEAAAAWLKARKGDTGLSHVSDEDRAAFLYYAAGTYFRITTEALRSRDPNHLCLGPRLNGRALRTAALWRAAGEYLDVVAVNYYGAWTPNPDLMAMWARESRRPFLVSEWYAKGEDSGLPNKTGAGWLVKTQADRGRFYQNFALGLLASRDCVGWHWFKYRDNNPEEPGTDPSNRDSNKGIVSYTFTPYAPLLAAMKRLNEQVYPLAEFFDAR